MLHMRDESACDCRGKVQKKPTTFNALGEGKTGRWFCSAMLGLTHYYRLSSVTR